MLTWNAEAVEGCALRVGAVEGVEVNAGNVVIQEVVAVLQPEVDTDAADHFAIVFATLQARKVWPGT